MGKRFKFGKNWREFATVIDQNRIQTAISSLTGMLQAQNLEGKKYLDIGSGSGLFSLAARKLGAQVYSFDYDPESVICTRSLKDKHYPNDAGWIVEEGSILDKLYIDSLGQFDIVYAWGVLHHTNEMWQAIKNASRLVKGDGVIFISIYNDQGVLSKYWKLIKRMYNKKKILRGIIIMLHMPYLLVMRYIVRVITKRTKLERGMSLWHDMKDWVGGYPFEVAKPEEILEYFNGENYKLERLKTCAGRHGCNEYIFKKQRNE